MIHESKRELNTPESSLLQEEFIDLSLYNNNKSDIYQENIGIVITISFLME